MGFDGVRGTTGTHNWDALRNFAMVRHACEREQKPRHLAARIILLLLFRSRARAKRSRFRFRHSLRHGSRRPPEEKRAIVTLSPLAAAPPSAGTLAGAQ